MKKIRKRKSLIRQKRRRKKGFSVVEKLSKDFGEFVSEMKRIIKDGLKQWDFLAAVSKPSSKKRKSKSKYARARARISTRARKKTRARKQPVTTLCKVKTRLQRRVKDLSILRKRVFSFLSEGSTRTHKKTRTRKKPVTTLSKVKTRLQRRAKDLSILRKRVFSFLSEVKCSLSRCFFEAVVFLKRVITACVWFAESLVVVLIGIGMGFFAVMKYTCIVCAWTVKWIIVCLIYVGFALTYIVGQGYRFAAFTIREMFEGIVHCTSYVNQRLKRELLLALFIVGVCALVGAFGFQVFLVIQKQQGKLASVAHSQEQLVAMASPGIELIDSESVTTGSSQSGPIHVDPVVTDSFCSSQSCNTDVVPACSRMCTVPERVVPLTQDISPCVLMATVRHTWGRGIGLDDGYTSIEQMLFPVELGKNIWPFLDFRLHGLDGGELAANVGVGYRYYSTCRELAFGMNAYYDYRETSRHTRFSQFGIGFEILGKCWGLRLNGYFPIRETKLLKTCFWRYPGGYFIEKKKYEEAKRGIDFELGARLGSIDLFGCSCRTEIACLNFYAAAGPYYYRGDKCNIRNIVGGKFRMRIESGRYLSVEGSVTRDSFYKTRFQVQLALHIPIGCCSCDKGAERVLSQPVQRNEMIVIDEFCRWRWNY